MKPINGFHTILIIYLEKTNDWYGDDLSNYVGYMAINQFYMGSGSLPPGLWLDQSGYIAGIPEQAGEYMFTIFLANPGGWWEYECRIIIH